jgi:alkylation response protein AidB-like acyl-CoA dehydrogenase
MGENELEAFRLAARAWLAEAVPTLPTAPPAADLAARRRYDQAWQSMLYQAGYAGLAWPAAYGGRGATAMEELVFLEECDAVGAPDIGVNFPGQLFVGPTLIAEGSEEHKSRYLAPILRGEECWCQGFSEPNAGSDLASLRTRAVRDGDEYVITGQKVWTSYCAVADFCELLVRTDPDAPQSRGITCLIVPMHIDGVEVRPLRTIVGYSEFGEVFFDGARVPVTNRLGDENDGWRVARVTLGFERGTAFARGLLQLVHATRQLKELAQDPAQPTERSWQDATVRRALGELTCELDAVHALLRANVDRFDRDGVLGPEASVFKLAYSEASQRVGDLAVRILGPAALVSETLGGTARERTRDAFQALSLTIAGGTSEIQRNIISEACLGLPREPRAVG